MKKLLAGAVLAVVVIGVICAARWGTWRQAVVHVTGQVTADFAFSAHSGGLSLQPCRDSVTSAARPAYRIPEWHGYMLSGGHTIYYFGGSTARSDATVVGTPLSISRTGTYGVVASMMIDGRGYSFYNGTVSIRPDGSATATLGGNAGNEPENVVTVTARVSWTCRGGLLPSP